MRKHMDWIPFAVLGLCVVVLLVITARQQRRIDELWIELDSQRAWLHAVDDGVRWEVTGGGVEAHAQAKTGTVR